MTGERSKAALRVCSTALMGCMLLQGQMAHADPPAATSAPSPVAPPATAPPAAAAPAPTNATAPTTPGVTPAPTEPVAPSAAAPGTPSPAPQVTAPAPPPAPSASAPPPSAAPPETAPNADRVWVHFGVNYPNASLETRSVVESDEWTANCTVPCKQYVEIGGREARVTAPGMTPSNAFRLQTGRGRVQFRVSGGSQTVKTLGLAGLIGGIPVAMAGMTLTGVGIVKDKDGMRDVGFVVLGLGAVAIAVAIPLLLASTTRVYNEKGSRIAALEPFRF